MKKLKLFVSIIILVTIILIIPNISRAESLTYKDTQNIEWSYEVDKNDNVINIKCETTSATGTITVPSKIDEKTVISLKSGNTWGNDSAFDGCDGITGVTIPDTITTISSYAFSNCKGLKSIVIPNSVTSIERNAFSGCSSLNSVTLPDKLTSINKNTFSNCTSLTSINLPKSITSIKESAFAYCSGLKSIIIPEGVHTIETSAFCSCSGMKSISIPDTVVSIGSKAFDSCKGLTEINIPKGITKIDEGTFKNCSGLVSVKIPENVTTICGAAYVGAFQGCDKLSKVLIPDSVSTIEGHAFDGCPKLIIYGNDGQASKIYAEENKIPFDYIKNWDKASTGSDVTPPTVQKIELTSSSIKNGSKDYNKNLYMMPSKTKIVINVTFSEAIKGTTIPTLEIKFGNGNNIKLTNGTVGSSVISYEYTITDNDKGTLSTVSLSGGNITDAAGNASKLSCPKIVIQGESDKWQAYANGTASTGNTNTGSNNAGNSNASSNTGSTNTNNQNTNTGNTGSTNTGNTGATNNKDKTTASGKLPQTGKSVAVSFGMILMVVTGIVLFKKYRNYKDI